MVTSRSDYRYIVTVKTASHRPPWVREVVVDGPRPEKAVNDALASITDDTNSDLWQSDAFTISVARAR